MACVDIFLVLFMDHTSWAKVIHFNIHSLRAAHMVQPQLRLQTKDFGQKTSGKKTLLITQVYK